MSIPGTNNIRPMSPVVKDFLVGLFESHVQEVVCDPTVTDGVIAWFEEAKLTARFLGLDVDEVIGRNGTRYEQKRLAEMLGFRFDRKMDAKFQSAVRQFEEI